MILTPPSLSSSSIILTPPSLFISSMILTLLSIGSMILTPLFLPFPWFRPPFLQFNDSDPLQFHDSERLFLQFYVPNSSTPSSVILTLFLTVLWSCPPPPPPPPTHTFVSSMILTPLPISSMIGYTLSFSFMIWTPFVPLFTGPDPSLPKYPWSQAPFYSISWPGNAPSLSFIILVPPRLLVPRPGCHPSLSCFN